MDSWLLCHLSPPEVLTENVFLTHQFNRLYCMQICHRHIAFDVNAELMSFLVTLGSFQPPLRRANFGKSGSETNLQIVSRHETIPHIITFYGEFCKLSTPVEWAISAHISAKLPLHLYVAACSYMYSQSSSIHAISRYRQKQKLRSYWSIQERWDQTNSRDGFLMQNLHQA